MTEALIWPLRGVREAGVEKGLSGARTGKEKEAAVLQGLGTGRVHAHRQLPGCCRGPRGRGGGLFGALVSTFLQPAQGAQPSPDPRG